MLIAHLGKTPQVHPDAYIAPNAVICGDVTIRSDCRILFGAQVIAEGGSIKIGRECIVGECGTSCRRPPSVHHWQQLPNRPQIPPEAGTELCFAELKDPVKDKLKRFGLFAQFGEGSFFPTIGAAVNAYLATHSVDWVDWEDRTPIRRGRLTHCDELLHFIPVAIGF